MSNDSLKNDSPAAQSELEWLTSAKIGDKRKGELMPALPSGEIVWELVKKTGEDGWELDATFFGVLLMTVVIERKNDTLELTIKELSKVM